MTLDDEPSSAETDGAATGLRFRPGRGRGELAAWIAASPRAAPGAPALVAVHGITRDAEGVARRLAARAARQGRTLVAPLFDEKRFPRYQRARCPRRADRALLDLLGALSDEGVVPRGRVDLAGYSGGAQFAHRFAWFYPHRVGRLAVAAAGWWTFPDAAPFPYGLGPCAKDPPAARLLAANVADFLDREIAVAVGAQDRAPDANTRSGPVVDAQQGRDRLTRARRWVDAVAAAAERHGIQPRVTLTVLPGCGHDFDACARAGLDRLFLPAS